MTVRQLKHKWFEIVNQANSRGIPVPLIRDAKTGMGSISLTLVFLSFNVWLMSVLGKLAGYFGGINTDQCLNMFLACAGLYFGRKLQKDDKKLDLEEKEDENEKP